MSNLQDIVSEAMVEAQARLDQIEAAISVRKKEKESLVSEIAKLKARQDTLDQKVAAADTSARQAIRDHINKEKEYRSKIDKINADYEKSSEQLIKVTDELASKLNDLATLKQQIQDSTDYLAKQEESVQTILEGYQEQLHNSNARIDALVKEEATIKEATAVASEVLEDVDKQVESLKDSVAGWEERLAHAKEVYQENITVMRSDIEKAKQELAETKIQTENETKKAEKFTSYMAEEKAKLKERQRIINTRERELSDGFKRLESDRSVLT